MWYSLGVQLEISVGTLKRIELENRQITKCLLEMLIVWLQRTNPSPTWNALIEALESSPVDERPLADFARLTCTMSHTFLYHTIDQRSCQEEDGPC